MTLSGLAEFNSKLVDTVYHVFICATFSAFGTRAFMPVGRVPLYNDWSAADDASLNLGDRSTAQLDWHL